MADVIREHITRTDGICGGRACITGHRIRVMDIVALCHNRGFCPEEVAYQYPGISLADVHAALAYYLDHRDEIDADFALDDEIAKRGAANQPSLLREKVGG